MRRSLLPDYFQRYPTGERLRRDLFEINARVSFTVSSALLSFYSQELQDTQRIYETLWEERGFPEEMQKVFGLSVLVDENQATIAVPLFRVHKTFEATYLREPYMLRKEVFARAFLDLLSRPLPDSEVFELLIALLNGEDIEDLLR